MTNGRLAEQGEQQMRSTTRTGRRTPATAPGPRRAGADRRVTLGLLAAAATVAVASLLHLGGRNPPGFTTPAPTTTGLTLRTTEVTYLGGTEHIRTVRADLRTVLDDCPRADDVILCASELAANAAQHSRSRLPGGTFTVRVAVSPGRYARVEVQDNGGPWNQAVTGSARYHGLEIIRAVADEWGIDGDHATRTIWARFDWPRVAVTEPAVWPRCRWTYRNEAP
jgi:serine/threonine-protein kinase RsbW